MFILKTIAEGSRKLSEIANATGIDKGALSRYLHNLRRVGIVDSELPATVAGKSKRSLYKIKDNYFKFYFRFVLPNKNNIEAEIDITPKIEKEYNQYLGFVFEELVRDLIRRRRLDIGLVPDDCGAWWYRGDEIDIVATGADADGVRQLFAGEVNARREYYGIIAKRIEDKETLRGGGVYAFDLEDILSPV